MSTSSDIARVEVRVDQPLNLPLTLESGQAFRWHEADGVWSGFIRGELVTLQRTDDGLSVQCSVPAVPGIQDAVQRYFRLDDDLPAIYEELCKDERLSEAIHQHWGLRILRQEPWECLTAFICSQNSNIPRIAKMQESLANELGQTYTLGGIQRQGFPTPEALASAGEETLRTLALGYRVPAVRLEESRSARVIVGITGPADTIVLLDLFIGDPRVVRHAALAGDSQLIPDFSRRLKVETVTTI